MLWLLITGLFICLCLRISSRHCDGRIVIDLCGCIGDLDARRQDPARDALQRHPARDRHQGDEARFKKTERGHFTINS